MSTLRGNLQSIALTDVVQLLHVNKKTGKLYLIQGKHSGILYVLNGDVVHAETPQTVGESAAFEVLEWTTGEFEFVAAKFKAPTSIRRSVPDLLMESARTADSRKHLHSIFPNPHAIPWPSMPWPQAGEGLKLFPEDRRILPFLDGFRDFSDIIAVTEQSEVAVLQACATLQGAGRLHLLEPDLTLAVAPMKTGLFRKGDHVELAKSLEAQWRALPPYGSGIPNVRIIGPHGPAVERVHFTDSLGDQAIAIPKELMQAWELPEGIYVRVRPAP